MSDMLGRKNTYFVFFVLGIILYCLLPTWGHLGLAGLFVASICMILTMYGGGFATVPAYLADIFGTQMVGAIHGRLITAWSVGGRRRPGADRRACGSSQLDHGVPHNLVYDGTLYIMAVLLLVGLICNVFIRPVNEKHLMTEDGTGARARAAARRPHRRQRRDRGARRRWRRRRCGVARGRHSVLHRPVHRAAKGGGADVTADLRLAWKRLDVLRHAVSISSARATIGRHIRDEQVT